MLKWKVLTVAVGLIAMLSLAAGMSEGAEGDEEEPSYVATIGETGYLTLAEAVDAAQYGDIIVLQTDIVLEEPLLISKDVEIDGADHTLTGAFVLDSTGDGDSYDVGFENIVFASAGKVISTSSQGDSVRKADLAVDGCIFHGSISVTNCGSVTVKNCMFQSGTADSAVDVRASGITGATVTITDNTFEGAYSEAAVVVSQAEGASGEMRGSIGSLTIGDNTFPSEATDLKVGGSTAYEAGVPLKMTISSLFTIEITAGSETVGASIYGTTSFESTYSGGIVSLSFQGLVSLSGNAGSRFSITAIGDIALQDFTGQVWFNVSKTIGAESSGAEGMELNISTMGMTLEGTTGEFLDLTGSYTVNGDLDLGGTMTVPEDSSVTVGSMARVADGRISNSGTVEVYGSISSDISNSGTVNAHRGAVISGNVTGNSVVYPVPAVVTMVLNAVAGEVFSITLVAEEGTTIEGFDGPGWLRLNGTTLAGVPPEAGTFNVTVTAMSAEYTTSLQYRIVVAEPPPVQTDEGEWNLVVIVAVLVAAFVAIGLMILRWVGRL